MLMKIWIALYLRLQYQIFLSFRLRLALPKSYMAYFRLNCMKEQLRRTAFLMAIFGVAIKLKGGS